MKAGHLQMLSTPSPQLSSLSPLIASHCQTINFQFYYCFTFPSIFAFSSFAFLYLSLLFGFFEWFYRLSASLRFIVLADLLCFILFSVALCTNSYLLLSLLKYIYIDIYIYIFVFAYFRFSPICLALFNFYLPKISWSLLSASAFLGIYM